MTTEVEVVNLALQYLGTRTTVTEAELAAESSNEAIQANLIRNKLRDQILRMAPWNCALRAQQLVYITSSPGTPENQSPATALWEPGQPMPPWAYEYQYPVDCLRPCWIIPGQTTGYTGGVPITTAVTGVTPIGWTGQPVMYKVATDRFFMATAAAVSAGGSGYAINDEITLNYGDATDPPIGGPAQVRVTNVVAGAISAIELINIIPNTSPAKSGSYFQRSSIPGTQYSTTGSGTGAVISLTMANSRVDQRVILTNQQFAILAYIKQVTDPNVMDDLFLDAWEAALGARLCMALTGDKDRAKLAIEVANRAIAQARAADGNEGLTINNVTPDWIRIRGYYDEGVYNSPYVPFDWGNMLTLF